MSNKTQFESTAEDHMTFGEVITLIDNGGIAARVDWPEGQYIYKAIGSIVPNKFVANMTSIPDAVKAAYAESGKDMNFASSITLQGENGVTKPGYVPSQEDLLYSKWVQL